jgi:Domain of unknown function (DUF4062)
MAEHPIQYRIFIGSPGGLDQERECFRSKLKNYTDLNTEPRGVLFHPVGWEGTLGGVGRPQERINEGLKRCDYAVFVFHDRWGSPSGEDDKSRTEAELALAEELYKANKLRNIVILFKKVNPRQMQDPGDQLKKVLEFKKRIEQEEKYLYTEYNDTEQFSEILEAHLAKWLKDHDDVGSTLNDNPFVAVETIASGAVLPVVAPNFSYWMNEAKTLSEAPDPDYASVLFCARKATNAARSDVEWAQGANMEGIALFHLGKPDEAIATFSAITERMAVATDRDPG